MEYNGSYTLIMQNNSVYKICMMYRIVYTKLSYSLLSQCGYTTNTQSIRLLDCLPSAAPRINRLAEYICVYTPCIGSISNTLPQIQLISPQTQLIVPYNTIINSAKCSSVGSLPSVGYQPKTTSTSHTKLVARCNNSEIYSGKFKNGQTVQHVWTAVLFSG